MIGLVITITNSEKEKNSGIWGEEIVANALCRGIKECGYDCFVVGHNDVGKYARFSTLIHYSDMLHPAFIKNFASRNLLYIQGVKYRDAYKGELYDVEQYYLKKRDCYDGVITSSKVLADKYDLPFIPACVDFDYYHPIDTGGFRWDITHIGNFIKPKKVNDRYLAPMAEFNYELFGGHFGKISHQEGLSVICSSKINLNYSFEENITYDMVLGRIMHISACQAFTLSDKVPTFIKIYNDAVGFTDGYDDEVEKIKYYLAHPDLCKAMAKKAYEITKWNFNHKTIAEKLLQVKGVV